MEKDFLTELLEALRKEEKKHNNFCADCAPQGYRYVCADCEIP